MITTPSARSIPCALGSCPAHGLGHPVILSFGSKVKVVCAHINHILCADTVSSAGDSHEQFPRSRSTHKRKKGLELVTAIMTQSFIKSNYEQPQTVAIKSWSLCTPWKVLGNQHSLACMKALSNCTCVSKKLSGLQLIKNLICNTEVGYVLQ